MSEIAPDSEEEYEKRRNELIEEAAKSKQELEQKQNEALAAIAEDDELEDYETVKLGELELEVKLWIPGDTTDTVHRAFNLAQSGEIEQIKTSMSAMEAALADMTVSDDYNQQFWNAYYNEYGPKGMLIAVDTILGPAMTDIERKKEGIDGFRGNVEGSNPRPSDGTDGPTPE